MFRLIFILITITALSLGAAWIADEPGRVVIDWGQYHIEMSVLVVLAGTCIAALWCMIIYYILYAVFRAPRTLLRSRLARRQALGLEALTAAFAAIATQDMRAARRQIGKAQQYLPHQPLTLMLASQVARLEGNESQSRLYLEQMLKAESTEFMALRGLIETARRSNDDETALHHAEKALALKPRDAWLTRTLVGLYAKKQRTQDALRLLGSARRRRTLSGKEHQSLSAMVLYEHAKPLIKAQRFELAIPSLKEALRLKADFVPASALLASAYAQEGDMAGALKVIGAAWKAAPHPLLTQAMLQCFETVKTRDKVTRRAEKLARMHPEHRESRFLIASFALKNGDTEIARNEIQVMLDGRETVRACGLMAQAQQALGNGAAASDWLKRSNSALPDPGYACDNCNQPADDWRLSCLHCGSVGSITWR
jgi:HemY protein